MSPTINNNKESANTAPSPLSSTDNNDPSSANSSNSQNNQSLSFYNMSDNLRQLTTNVLPPYVPVPPPVQDKTTFVVNCCTDCGDAFALKSSLKFHLERRSVLIKFPCDACQANRVFFNRCALLSHIRAHADKNEKADIKLATVDPLPEIFANGLAELDKEWDKTADSSESNPQDILEVSLKETSDPVSAPNSKESKPVIKKVKCSDCNALFETAEARRKHLTNNDEVPFAPSQCTTCGMYCPSKCCLKAHQRLHLQVSPYICPECGDSPDYYWVNFQHHVKYKCFHYNRSIGYKCPACNRLSPSNESLLQHMELHTEKYLKCNSCVRAYNSVDMFQEHIATWHANLNTKVDFTAIFKCSICDVVFLMRDLMVAHHSTHLQNQVCKYVFNCTQCEKSFENKENLLQHINMFHPMHYRLVLQKKPQAKTPLSAITYRGKIECIICNCSFHSFQGYCVHLNRAHINVNQHCNVCFMVLTNRKEMVLHGQKHLKKGCAVCLLCDNKKFTGEKNLENHLSYHVGKLQICSACPICNELLHTQEDALKHLVIEHSLGDSTTSEPSIQRITCNLCNDAFSKEEDLKEHRRTKHASDQAKQPIIMAAFQETEPEVLPEVPLPEKLKSNTCAKCDFVSDDRKAFKEHLTAHKLKKSTHQCMECGFSFVVAPSLCKHLRAVHKIMDPQKYVEEEGSNYIPDTQVEKEASYDSLICSVCYKPFPTESELKTHMRSHGMAFIQANKSSTAN